MSTPAETLQPMSEIFQPAEKAFDDGLKHREEAKREAATDPAARWEAVQEFMVWAASQSTAPKMTPAACKAKERRLLAGMAGMFAEQAPKE
ncbi:MAG: hypothetical protein WCJ35_00820 [Planctomycetota bacterium]